MTEVLKYLEHFLFHIIDYTLTDSLPIHAKVLMH